MSFYNTLELNISSQKINNCNEIVEFLHTNKSIIKKNNKYIIENGCKITLSTNEPTELEKKLWIPLKNNFDLNCAFLKIQGEYNGCVYDFYRNTNCPG